MGAEYELLRKEIIRGRASNRLIARNFWYLGNIGTSTHPDLMQFPALLKIAQQQRKAGMQSCGRRVKTFRTNSKHGLIQRDGRTLI